ncbi:ubiquilin [Angomonas deanei]|nr:ubiquilin [Angomonas deanei]|eukprot:EPY26175.1 ubiquilin [Angomonas deanei]
MEFQLVSNVAERETIVVDDSMTLEEVRGLIAAVLGTSEDNSVTLTYNGKNLVDDSTVFTELISVIDGDKTVTQRKLFCHVGKGKAKDVSLESLRANLPSKESVAADESAKRSQAKMMEPMVDMMVRNPQYLQMMLRQQPDLKETMEKSPEVARMLQDPETLKDLIMSQIDPDRGREMSTTLRSQLAQLDAIPGGRMMLERYTHDLGDTNADINLPKTKDDLYCVPEEDARPNPNQETNTAALQNPWATPSASASANRPTAGGGFPPVDASMLSAAMSMFAPQTASNPTANPFLSGGNGGASLKERFASQLSILKDMGFEDEQLCLSLLERYNGDVEAVVDHFAQMD